MLDRLMDVLQNRMVIVCTILTLVIPYSINFINRKMHEVGDPPWKRDK